MMCRVLLLLAVMVCFVQHAVAVERHARTISLLRAAPDEVAAVIKPLLSEGSVVMTWHNDLVLNVTDEEFKTINALIKQLDVPPRQLLITLRTPGSRQNTGQIIGIDEMEGKDGKKQASVVISTGSSRHGRKGEQTVRATEGSPAYISAGREVPVTTGVLGGYGHDITRTDYKRAERGFYVTARVQGDRVILDIRHADDSVSFDKKSFDRRTVDTQISGKVGEWMTLGSTRNEGTGHTSGITVRRHSTADSVSEVLVKVDVLE